MANLTGINIQNLIVSNKANFAKRFLLRLRGHKKSPNQCIIRPGIYHLHRVSFPIYGRFSDSRILLLSTTAFPQHFGCYICTTVADMRGSSLLIAAGPTWIAPVSLLWTVGSTTIAFYFSAPQHDGKEGVKTKKGLFLCPRTANGYLVRTPIMSDVLMSFPW